MPYISTQISTSLSPDKETALKAKFGNAIKLLGKTESWLMLSFEDNCRLWFQGNQEKPCAIGAGTQAIYKFGTGKKVFLCLIQISCSRACATKWTR